MKAATLSIKLDHPLTAPYPMMGVEAFKDFKADIAARGLLQPGYYFDGLVLDGRERVRACAELGIQMEWREFNGTEDEARSFVQSQNIHRKHYSSGQLAYIAILLRDSISPSVKRKAYESWNKPGFKRATAAAVVAKDFGIGEGTVARAATIRERNPAMFEKMGKGEVSAREAWLAVKKTKLTPATREPEPDETAEEIFARMANDGWHCELRHETSIGWKVHFFGLYGEKAWPTWTFQSPFKTLVEGLREADFIASKAASGRAV